MKTFPNFFLEAGTIMVFALACILGASQISYAQPINNYCTDALTITNNSEVCGTTVDASEDLPNNGDACVYDADALGQGVWYTFVGNGSSWAFYFEADPDWDPEVNVYSGSCSVLTCVTGNDDNGQGYGGFDASFMVNTVPGLTYYMYVHDCCGGVNTFCYTVGTVQTLCNLGATLNGTSEVCSGGYRRQSIPMERPEWLYQYRGQYYPQWC